MDMKKSVKVYENFNLRIPTKLHSSNVKPTLFRALSFPKVAKIKILFISLLFVFALSFILAASPVNVGRLIETEAIGGEDFTKVSLGIVSLENVLAITEEMDSEECFLVDWRVEPEIDIAEVNEFEFVWVLANRSDEMSVELIYYVPSSCSPVRGGGEVLIVTSEDTLDGFDIDTGLINNGNGGSSGGGGETFDDVSGSLASTQVVDYDTRDEYEDSISKFEKLIGLDGSNKIEWGSFGTILVLVVVAAIILFVIVGSFFKRPKQFKK